MRKKILLLGSGELGKELVIALQRYGQYVIAVDSYENAPAMQVADEFEVIDMLDGAALAERSFLGKVNRTLLQATRLLSRSSIAGAVCPVDRPIPLHAHRGIAPARRVCWVVPRQALRM